MKRGRVILVGAGPGDPELLTVKAVRAIEAAEVILHDALVAPEILDLAPRARRIAVGKRAGCPSTSQQFIHQLMIREARAGRLVVRLKGGDPFVFGRGGEEMHALKRAGIDVCVIPGITAASAAAAVADVPLTHRGIAPGVALVTGHSAQPGSEPDWTALARSGMTLAIYMAVARLPLITAQLRAAGMPARTPVAVVSNASRSDQSILRTTLSEVCEDLRKLSPRSHPAVILVGEACSAVAQSCRATDEPRYDASGASAAPSRPPRRVSRSA